MIDARQLAQTAEKLNAQPLVILSEQNVELIEQRRWDVLKAEHLPKLETAIQGTVALFRNEHLLDGTTRLPGPLSLEPSNW